MLQTSRENVNISREIVHYAIFVLVLPARYSGGVLLATLEVSTLGGLRLLVTGLAGNTSQVAVKASVCRPTVIYACGMAKEDREIEKKASPEEVEDHWTTPLG